MIPAARAKIRSWQGDGGLDRRGRSVAAHHDRRIQVRTRRGEIEIVGADDLCRLDVDDIDSGANRVVLGVGHSQRGARVRDRGKSRRERALFAVRFEKPTRAHRYAPERGAHPGVLRPPPERFSSDQCRGLTIVLEQGERCRDERLHACVSLPTAPPLRPGPRRARRRRSPRRAAHLHPRPPNAADDCSARREQRVRRVRVPRLVPARRTRRGNRSPRSVRSGSECSRQSSAAVKAGAAQQVLVADDPSRSRVRCAVATVDTRRAPSASSSSQRSRRGHAVATAS